MGFWPRNNYTQNLGVGGRESEYALYTNPIMKKLKKKGT